MLLSGAILLFVPILSPATGAATADLLRSVVGPEPVAYLESLSYWMRDTLYQLSASTGETGPAVNWSGSPGPEPENLVDVPAASASAPPPASPPLPTPTAMPEPTPTPVLDVVTAPPEIGWQAYGPAPEGSPLLARALVMVDPSRSYAGVALVRMDLSRLELHIMAGFIEPAHPSGISKLVPELGTIPAQDQPRLVAAFNGGFKAVHGHYGMLMDGISLLPPVDGMGTVAVYQDGSVRIGAWGRGLLPSPDMISFRQNCPPLIENGQLNPGLSTNARKAWGITNNTDVMWRTGVGITQDERYLIYAVGNGTSLEFLAEALQRAGADNAIQLDINQYYSHFVTYADVMVNGESQLQAERLLEQMINTRRLYLDPSPRDFFYLTVRGE